MHAAETPRIAERGVGLKERFNRDWWMHDEQFFALALDPDKTSGRGRHVERRALPRDRNHRRGAPCPVVGRLFAPDMFSGWGIERCRPLTRSTTR